MDAEDPLFLLYTSGSTGKPKGVLHTVGAHWTRRVAPPNAGLHVLEDVHVVACAHNALMLVCVLA